MDFFISKNETQGFKFKKVIGDNNLYYNTNEQLQSREFIYESDELFIIADTNLSFKKRIEGDVSIKSVIENWKFLKNGFLVFCDKGNGRITLVNDIFGFSGVYYIKNNKSFLISSNFNSLIQHTNKEIDSFSVLDIILFNYTLIDRTFLKDIKRLQGGTIIENAVSDWTIKVTSNYAINFQRAIPEHKFTHKKFSELLLEAIDNEVEEKDINVLTTTAGFDSRALLAAFLNLGINFSSLTFGQKGNIEIETVRTFINEFSKKHEEVLLDIEYVQDLKNITNKCVTDSLNSPLLLDIIHYRNLSPQVPNTNLIAGYMGGELIIGQSLGSQVTFTNAAGILLTAKNEDERKSQLLSILKGVEFVNFESVEESFDEYINSLSSYFYQNSRLNILKFLINEKYSKFFGTVNNYLKDRFNLIVPFMDTNLIDYILNSEISFLKKEPFINSPISNFSAKRTYAQAIKHLYPKLSKTKLDRLYTVNDLAVWYRTPVVLFGYFQSHVLRKNKKEYPKPHHYDLWLGEIIANKINRSDISEVAPFFLSDYSIDVERYSKQSSHVMKKLANLLSICLAYSFVNKNS